MRTVRENNPRQSYANGKVRSDRSRQAASTCEWTHGQPDGVSNQSPIAA